MKIEIEGLCACGKGVIRQYKDNVRCTNPSCTLTYTLPDRPPAHPSLYPRIRYSRTARFLQQIINTGTDPYIIRFTAYVLILFTIALWLGIALEASLEII